MAGDQGQAQIP
jgi:superfamily II RNA helicase